MNLFFDELSQKLILDAKNEMFLLKHPYVGSEHLLLSILKDTSLDITKMLNTFGISYDSFKNELIRVVGLGSKSNSWFLFTPLLKRVITNAAYFSKDNSSMVTPYSLLVSILQEGDGVANRILLGMGVDLNALYEKFVSFDSYNVHLSDCKFLMEFGVNMNECVLNNKYDPLIGREDQINSIIRILLRKNKNNPLLIGDAGVGKTAIVEELARRIQFGNVPISLQNKVIYNISMSSLVAGTKYRGEFEEKVQKLIKEVISNKNIILFIDEIHTLIGAGGAEGAIDASNILKPYLARNDLTIIGATTIFEYSNSISKDKALDRRFQKVYIAEPTYQEVKEIVQNLLPIYEKYHRVTFSNDLLEPFLQYSFSSLDGKQPDKTIDLLDEVCSYASIHNDKKSKLLSDYQNKIRDYESQKNQEIINHNFKQALNYKNMEMDMRSKYNNELFHFDKKSSTFISLSDIEYILLKRAGAPSINEIKMSFEKKLDFIKKNVCVQEDIIIKVFSILSNYDFLRNSMPVSFLFLGKKGCGKSFFVSKIKETLFPSCNYITLNMDDFTDEYSISKIVGTSSGYASFEHELVFDSLKQNSFSIILFDNIFHAHPKVLNLIRQILEKGFIRNAKNEILSFQKCILFFTSDSLKTSVGFIDSNDSELPFFDLKVQYSFYFQSISRNKVLTFLEKLLEQKGFDKKTSCQLSKDLYQSLDYEHCRFLKLPELLMSEKYLLLKS